MRTYIHTYIHTYFVFYIYRLHTYQLIQILSDYKYNSVCILLLELYIQVIILTFEQREMATRGPAPGALLCVDELERKLIDLSEQVELKKEEVRSNFQQLHGLLVVRETFLLKEMDDVVSRARQAINEKRINLQQLYTARESLERDLTQNTFKKLLEKNLRAIEDEIGEEVARSMNVGWMELNWKIEQLEQSVIEVCKVVTLKERPLTRIDYSARKCPVWSHDGTVSGEITNPYQLAIEDKTQNIFVTDYDAERIQVFDGEGNHLYQISTPPYPAGIAISDEYIFVSTLYKLVKIEKSNNQSIKSVETENTVWGLTLTLTQTFMDVRLATNQLLCLIKISNSSKESNSDLLNLPPIRVQEVSNCMKIRCMSCLVNVFLFLSLYRYSI